MPVIVVCRNGHSSELPAAVVSAAGRANIVCSVCGIETQWSPDRTEATVTVGDSPSPVATTLATQRSAKHRPTVPGYEITGTLGRGGMGVVYKARHIRLNRVVALKMILAGAHASPDDLARFQNEAEAVASLQHPGIVQIYEIGEHEGLPFFALEYVEGGCLSLRIAGEPQPPREAAQLTEAMARAIHVAHRAGVVHRDLKPANVLLTDDGRPKITDFGLAKRTDADVTQTRPGAILGTPSYMAPEQALGKSDQVGVRSDVYSLGAILYEILTGRPPFRAATPVETLAQVGNDEPVPPRQLNSKIPIDIETIVLKCLQKDPRRRFETAESLADDLRRFLAGELIHARPVSQFERAVNWSRRHPAAAALVLMVCLAATGIVTFGTLYHVRLRHEMHIAEENLGYAREAVDKMLGQAERLLPTPETVPARRALLDEAKKFYAIFRAQRSHNVRIRIDVARADRRFAEVQRQLKQIEDAQESFRRAIDALEQLDREFPELPEIRSELAISSNFLGELLRLTGDLDGATAKYRRAVELQTALSVSHPSRNHQKELAHSLYNLGIATMDRGNPVEADAIFRRTIEIQESLVAKHPTFIEARQGLARSYLNHAVLLRLENRLDDAEKAYLEAIRLYESVTKAIPDEPSYRLELAQAFNNFGNLFFGQPARRLDAEPPFRAALDILNWLAKTYPSMPDYQEELGNAYNGLGSFHYPKNLDQAAENWTLASKIFAELQTAHPTVPVYKSRAGLVTANLARLARNRGDYSLATTLYEQARDRVADAKSLSLNHIEYRRQQASLQVDLANVLLQRDAVATAATTALVVADLAPDRWRDYLRAAAVLADCVGRTTRLSSGSPMAVDTVADEYGEQAMRLLRLAVKAGLKDPDVVRNEPRFEALRTRPDFRELLGTLDATRPRK